MTEPMFGNHTPSKSAPHAAGTGEHHWFNFPNGYGASVVRFSVGGFGGSYGAESGLWELAVLDSAGHLTYETPITDDVLGYLSDAEVADTLDKIAALPEPAEVSA